MTYRSDVTRGRNIVARWCDLAERRLEYLTELFETGRWRRFHSEVAFLENIQEAKAAVETWRMLLNQEGAADNSAVDTSWLHRKPLPPRNTIVLNIPAKKVGTGEAVTMVFGGFVAQAGVPGPRPDRL